MIPEPGSGVDSESAGPGQLELDRPEPEIGVVSLIGEHDLHTSDDARARIKALLGEGCSVIIDLTRTTFCDSSILAVLVEAHEGAADRDLGFAIALPEGNEEAVRRVLDVTGLTSTLNTHPDRDSAIASARGGNA